MLTGTGSSAQIRERARGCAVGAAVGDALGMPLEFGPPRTVGAFVLDMIPGRLEAGTFTDDTEMALALAESLIERHAFDPVDLAMRFVEWYRGEPDDIGIHTRLVLSRVAEGYEWRQAAEMVQQQREQSAGNGSVMRCWPVALAGWRDEAQMALDSRLQSHVTHTHRECVAGCAYVNTVIYALLHGAALNEALAYAMTQVNLPEELYTVVDQAGSRARADLVNSGWVRHTLESVVWGLRKTNCFADAVIEVVNLGNDADTAGAVVGAIAGAAYGLSAIPARWQRHIHGEWPLGSRNVWWVDDLVKLSDRLLDSGQVGS